MENENPQSSGPTKKCPKCGEAILVSAKKCKHCQADIRNWFARHKIITGILTLIVIGIIASASGGSKDQSSDSASDTKTSNKKETADAKVPTAKTVPDLIVTAAAIAKDYADNEVAADGKYKGKLIEISGTIDGVDNGVTDNEMIVKLADGKYGVNDPYCNMQVSEHDKVVAFKKGQSVTLIGTGNSATLGSPQLQDCVVK